MSESQSLDHWDRRACLIKINDVTLIEPSDNLAGFKSFDGAVSCSLVTEDPLVGEDASPLQRSAVSEDPCFAGFESSDFNVHSCAPFFGIGTCEGMARGFGFNPFWWAGDNYVEAEDVKSGEAGVVPLIACDFHHIVVRAVAAGGCGAEKRVAQGIEWSVILVVVFVAPWAWAGVGICGILIRERCLCFVFGGGEATRWALVVSNVMFSPSAVSMAVALELADGEIFVEDDVAGHDYARGAVVEDVPGMVLGADAEMHAPTGAALEFPHGHCCWPILHHAAPDAVHGNVALVAGELEVRREVVGVGGGAGKIVETDSVMHGVGPVLRVNVALLQEGADPGHESAVGALSDALLGMSVGERELVDDSLLLQGPAASSATSFSALAMTSSMGSSSSSSGGVPQVPTPQLAVLPHPPCAAAAGAFASVSVRRLFSSSSRSRVACEEVESIMNSGGPPASLSLTLAFPFSAAVARRLSAIADVSPLSAGVVFVLSSVVEAVGVWQFRQRPSGPGA
ncbi:unnamed protein product [Closterium sp. NIES-54]